MALLTMSSTKLWSDKSTRLAFWEVIEFGRGSDFFLCPSIWNDKHFIFQLKAYSTLSNAYFSGTAGDSLGRHRGYGFTTKDRDNDSWNQNCASRYKGAWWYSDCIISSLNGVYLHGKHSKSWEGMVWVSWKGANYSVKRAEMKIRPVKA